MKSILNLFDERQDDVICSVYNQANTKKACKCKCVNQDVVELKEFINEPPFNYAKCKVELGIDQKAIEDAKFNDETIAFAKFVAQAILNEIPYDLINETKKLNKIEVALCRAINSPNDGSVMFALLVWCQTYAKELAYLQNKKNYKTVWAVLDEFLNNVIDIIGRTLYVGMVYIVKQNNTAFYRILGEQQETVQCMIAKTLDRLATTYKNTGKEDIVNLYNNYIMSDVETFRQWVGFMLFLKGRVALDYIWQVNNAVMAPLVKDKIKEKKNTKRDPVLNQYILNGGSMSFAELNQKADLEATLKGMACKGASALDEFFGTTCKCDSVSGLLGQVSKRVSKSYL